MRNASLVLKATAEKKQKKIRDIYVELIGTLFQGRQNGIRGGLYLNKLERIASKFNLRAHDFVHAALNELRERFKEIHLDHFGRITNPNHIGKKFDALLRIVSKNVDLFMLWDESQLHSPLLPLSSSFKNEFQKIIAAGEAVAILLVKHPPEETAREIQRVSTKCLNGLMSLWKNKIFQRSSDIRSGIKNYIRHATVKIVATGTNPSVNSIISDIDNYLEQHGGFEDSYWITVVKGVAREEKKGALKQILVVCIPIVAVIKALEYLLPTFLHAVGGILDDLFGAIIPDVSQSMGERDLPMSERSKNAMPVLKGGLITLPIAFGLGWFSAYWYGTTTNTGVHILCGILFALACCAGTLGTSIAAFRKALAAINNLEKDKTHGYLVSGFSHHQKLALALKESIMDVPFRFGHTVIGVPFQVALGIAAGAFGFFHNPIFIMVEGMAETVLGAVTAFSFPIYAKFKRHWKLRSANFSPNSTSNTTSNSTSISTPTSTNPSFFQS